MNGIYLIWDIIFTRIGVWGFNEDYLIGFTILSLPFEEWLFFICIPFASLFIHYNKIKLQPKWRLSESKTKLVATIIIVLLLILLILNFGKLYTTITFISSIAILILVLVRNISLLQDFLVSYAFILIPFFIVNGILTGSFIVEQVVWYNNMHNMGIRIGTIPFEDIFYGMTLLLGTLFLSSELKGPVNYQSK
jgi:lycopene cyclase domain-containing protein|tara:strand:- start:236 stop:814 length:579 start_codon:yes stop_codon:yes gene_type:complete